MLPLTLEFFFHPLSVFLGITERQRVEDFPAGEGILQEDLGFSL